MCYGEGSGFLLKGGNRKDGRYLSVLQPAIGIGIDEYRYNS